MQRLAAVMVMVVGLFGCDGNAEFTGPPPMLPHAAVTQQEWVSYTQYLPNFCTGEVLRIDGRYREVSGTTSNGNGLHLVVNSEDHVTALNLDTGTEYVGNETINRVLNMNAPLPFVGTIAHHFVLAGRGGSGLVFRYLRHVTVNANGEITTARTNLELGCR